MDYIKLVAQIDPEHPLEDAVYYDNCGADELYFYDSASFEEGGHGDIRTIQEISRNSDIPLIVHGAVRRFEDIKKMVYAGARTVVVSMEGAEDSEGVKEAIKEAIGRFGAERIFRMIPAGKPEETLERVQACLDEEGFGGILLSGDCSDKEYCHTADYLKYHLSMPMMLFSLSDDPAALSDQIRMSMPDALILSDSERKDMMGLKQALAGNRIPMNLFESAMDFDEFKLNSQGMIPCITQDYKTGEVLMLAYMTKESFEKTIATGKMTYYSRSRQELWTKGDTSGHFQYVKSLSIDCDRDTLLAKVAQVGAACHTGNRTCFYTSLLEKETDTNNPLEIFQQVYDTIIERKDHPKEGSYTNYLFDQGVDKILKKVGEEATEIVIAAKNPDSEELKYEICDFLYHMMVLMADRDLTWKEITDELAQRH